MKLIIVRHGETDRNKDKHHQAQGPIGLNINGRKQAELTAQRLKDEPIDIIYSSNLLRAQETAQIIQAFHPKAQHISDANLRERHSGVHSKQTVAEREATQKASGVGFRDWRPEGGESLRDVKQRATAWFSNLRDQRMHQNVLVVSHGFFLYTLLEVVIEDGADVEREEFAMSNCGLTILEIHPEGRVSVVHLNNITHLGTIKTLSSTISSSFSK